MSTTQIAPQGKDTAIPGELYMSFELSLPQCQRRRRSG
jgi:hypothetical protein